METVSTAAATADGLPSTRELIMTNLANILTESAHRHPDRPAIRLDDTLITYAELDDLTARAAGWLRARGIEPGDRVAIALPNVVQFPVFYYAVLRAGATVVPMNPLLKSREIQHHLADSGAKLALVWITVVAVA
jgi:long-chain acyl-CoA synthetase